MNTSTNQRSRRGAKLHRWAGTTLTAALLYVNAAAMCSFLRCRLPELPQLPLAPAVGDLFVLFGVFSHFEVVNREVILDGLCESTVNGVKTSSWIELDPEELLPFPRGEQLSRLAAARTWPGLPCLAPQEARRLLCARLRARHQLLHPLEPITRVRVGLVTWPRSSRGYEAERARAGASAQVWYED